MDESPNILVTGGAGYIGAQMVYLLLDAGFKSVVVVDNLSTGNASSIPDYIPFYVVDIANVEKMTDILKHEKIDIVLHFAAFVISSESMVEPVKYYRNNFFGTLNLLDAMVKAKVHRIVFSSSAAVYGESVKTPLTESHATNPVNAYGMSKLLCEEALDYYHKNHQINYISLRYFNAAGADPKCRVGFILDSPTHLIPRLLISIAGKDTNFYIYGENYRTVDGTCIRDYVHVVDLCRAHLLSYQHLKSGGSSGIINLGSGVGHSVKQVIEEAERVCKKTIPVHIAERRSGDSPMFVADIKQAKRLLNWVPERSSLDDILKDSWRWVNFELKKINKD